MHKRNALQDRLFKRGNIWWVWVYDHSGTKQRESTKQTERKAALAVARQIELRHALPPDNAAQQEYTLDEALTELIAFTARAGLSDASVTRHKRAARHLKRLWEPDPKKPKRLVDLSPKLSDAYMDKRLEERAGRFTIAMEFQTLAQALRIAADHKLFVGNPGLLIPRPLRDQADYYTPRDVWLKSADECNELLACISSSGRRTRDGRPRYTCRKLHVAAYIQTGVRKAELLRILPEDVDIDARCVWIRGTKTKGSARWVWLSQTAIEIFRRKLEHSTPGQPLFEHWAPGRASEELARAWKRARKNLIASGAPASKLSETLSFNDLRRSFCSLMASAGVPMQHCAKLLGHSGLDMVMRVYGRLSDESLIAAVDALPAIDLSTVSVSVHAGMRKAGPDAHVARESA